LVDLAGEIVRLVREVERDLTEDGYPGRIELLRSANMRYAGQNYELEITVPDDLTGDRVLEDLLGRFHAAHRTAYGYSMLDNPCELTQLNVVALGEGPPVRLPKPSSVRAHDAPGIKRAVYFAGHGWLETDILFRERVYPGREVSGPAVIAELDSTTLVHPDQSLEVDEFGFMILGPVGTRGKRTVQSVV
jgi:N-methylhydantoinase A